MLTLANPWLLTLLPLPLLLWYIIPQSKILPPTALKIPFFDAIKGIIVQSQNLLSIQSFPWLPMLIWSSLLVGLAGPRWVGKPIPLEREAYNIILALDLSQSMEIMDMVKNGEPVSRLSVVKKAAMQFVQARTSDKIGLVLFGTRAYLQTPLTFDKNNVIMRIEDSTAGLAGQTTSIGDALGLAVKRLRLAPSKGRVIILLTDGANNSGVLLPLKAAQLAKDEQIKVYTIGLGSKANQGAFFIPNASADLDEDTLKQIAAKTGGRYFRATDTKSLQEIYKIINQLEKVKQEQALVLPQQEYYPWFIAFALVLNFYWLWAKSTGSFKEKPWLLGQKL